MPKYPDTKCPRDTSEVSLRHFGTGAELSRHFGVLVPKCPGAEVSREQVYKQQNRLHLEALLLTEESTRVNSYGRYIHRVVLRIFTSISILYFSALKLPSSSVLICSSFFCIIALGSGQRLLYRLGSGLGLVLVLVLPYSVEVNILIS